MTSSNSTRFYCYMSDFCRLIDFLTWLLLCGRTVWLQFYICLCLLIWSASDAHFRLTYLIV